MNQLSNYIYPVLLLLAIFVFSEFTRGRNSKEGTYKANKYLLSSAENDFYQYLLKVIPAGFAVMSKVRVEDIVSTVRDRNYIFGRNKIRAKHVDFLIMAQSTGIIRGVIELNDRSHLRTDRQDRDQFLESVFITCGIPILWVPVTKYYENNHEITDYIERITAKQA